MNGGNKSIVTKQVFKKKYVLCLIKIVLQTKFALFEEVKHLLRVLIILKRDRK